MEQTNRVAIIVTVIPLILQVFAALHLPPDVPASQPPAAVSPQPRGSGGSHLPLPGLQPRLHPLRPLRTGAVPLHPFTLGLYCLPQLQLPPRHADTRSHCLPNSAGRHPPACSDCRVRHTAGLPPLPPPPARPDAVSSQRSSTHDIQQFVEEGWSQKKGFLRFLLLQSLYYCCKHKNHVLLLTCAECFSELVAGRDQKKLTNVSLSKRQSSDLLKCGSVEEFQTIIIQTVVEKLFEQPQIGEKKKRVEFWPEWITAILKQPHFTRFKQNLLYSQAFRGTVEKEGEIRLFDTMLQLQFLSESWTWAELTDSFSFWNRGVITSSSRSPFFNDLTDISLYLSGLFFYLVTSGVKPVYCVLLFVVFTHLEVVMQGLWQNLHLITKDYRGKGRQHWNLLYLCCSMKSAVNSYSTIFIPWNSCFLGLTGHFWTKTSI